MFTKKIIPLFAIALGMVLAVTSTGFNMQTNTVTSDEMAITWFTFTGNDPTDLSQVKNHLNYVYDGGQKCTGLTNKICAVRTNGPDVIGQHPSAFSATLLDEIEKVVNNIAPSTNVSQRP